MGRNYKAGYLAKLYYNDGTYGAPDWKEIDLLRDAQWTLEDELADSKTRRSGRWNEQGTIGTDLELTAEALWEPDDSVFEMLRAAYFADPKTEIELLGLDQDKSEASASGIRFTATVTRFAKTEPIRGWQAVSLRFTPTPAENAPSPYPPS